MCMFTTQANEAPDTEGCRIPATPTNFYGNWGFSVPLGIKPILLKVANFVMPFIWDVA